MQAATETRSTRTLAAHRFEFSWISILFDGADDQRSHADTFKKNGQACQGVPIFGKDNLKVVAHPVLGGLHHDALVSKVELLRSIGL